MINFLSSQGNQPVKMQPLKYIIPEQLGPLNSTHLRRWSPEFINWMSCGCRYCFWASEGMIEELEYKYPTKQPRWSLNEMLGGKRRILTKNGRMPWKIRRKG